MIPAAFAYQRPASIDEALALIGSDPGAKLLAGGQSLLPLLKLRLGSAETLVDIGRLPGLHGRPPARRRRLAIGALTTYAELLESPAAEYGLLRDALPHIGDVQVRNRGHGRRLDRPRRPGLGPAGLPARARRGARPPVGRRRADDRRRRVLRGRRSRPALEPGEILTEIRLPGRRDDAGSAYATLEQPASGYAIVGVAAVVFSNGRRDRRARTSP